MIGIVGGGVSGLALAYYLRERGVSALVLEASDRVGGVVRSSKVEGRVLDHGPQRMRLPPDVSRLVRGLGIEDRVRVAPADLPLFVYRHGALWAVPFTPAALLGSGLLSGVGRLRVLLEPLTAGPREGETVGAYFRRKVGTEAYEALAGPLFGGLYGSNPDHMYVEHALRQILDGLGVRRSLLLRYLRGVVRRAGRVPAVSFDEGMEVFPRALGRELGDELKLRTPVRRLAPEGAGWRVETDSDAWSVSEVVLTTPASVTARLLAEWAPDAGERIGRLRENPLAMVHMVADCGLRGWGYQVAFGERLRTRGVTWNAAIFRRDGVYTAFLGGAEEPGVVDLGDRELGEIACTEFRDVTGCSSRVVHVGRTRIPAWDRSWKALDPFPALPEGLRVFANWESRVGLPARIRGAKALAEELAG